MLIYWSLFSILAIGALTNHSQPLSRHRILFLLFAALPSVAMIGLRWDIGPDWRSYKSVFDYSYFNSLDRALAHQDPGFMVLNWAVHRLGGPFWEVDLACGAIFIAGLAAFCRRQPNPWLAYLVAFPYLVIVIGMSGLRQSIALGFLCFALNAYQRNRLIVFAALILAGALFHGSVLLMLPLCLLSHSRNWLQRTLLVGATLLLGYYFSQDAFQSYVERYSMVRLQSTGTVYRLAMNGLAAILYLAFQRRFDMPDQEGRLWRNMSIATIVLAILLAFLPSSTSIDRFLLYLFPLQFVVLGRLPRIAGDARQTETAFTFLVIGYAAAVQLVFLQFGTFASYYVPYRSIFEGTGPA